MSLRFVLLIDDNLVHAWQAQALQLLLDSGLAAPALIVRNGAANTLPVRSGGRWRQLRPRGTGLWQLFERWIAPRSHATQPAPLPAAIAQVEQITAINRRAGPGGQTFTPDEIAAIAATRPDFILRFGFGILRGDILSVAPHGVWSYHHGDPAAVRGQPPGFWEIYLGHPTTGVILQQLSAELDAGRILHAGQFGTIAHSYARQRDQLYFGAASWLRRGCAALAAGVLEPVPQAQLGQVRRKPTNLEFLRFAWRTAAASLAIHWRTLFVHQHWTVGVIERPVAEAVEVLTTPAARTVHWMPPSPGTFYADPFPLLADGQDQRLTLLTEAYPWAQGRGRIVAVDYARGGQFGSPRDVWSPDFHCSYPYVLQDEPQIFCIPETSASGATRRFPLAADGTVDFAGGGQPLSADALIDPTVIRHDGRYWLFAGDPHYHNTVLNLFYADVLDGPWQPHPLNPVKTDIGSARPAGRPFVVDGALIRPGQDCAAYYGAGIVLNRITALTPTDYAETAWKVLRPDPRAHDFGLHTISWTGDWTVIDGAKRRFVFSEFRRGLAQKLRLGQR